MSTLVSELTDQPWRRRLYIPAYRISEAAHYAGTSARTVADWHRIGGRKEVTLSQKEPRVSLNYFQLIEVAVVAAFRRAGVHLQRIRDAREYVSKTLSAEYPFATYRFKTDGKRLLMDYTQVEGERGRGKLLGVDDGGQLAWEEIIGWRLTEFDYDTGDNGIVIRWHVAGKKMPIIIDPQLSFGAPTLHGVPTWALKGRWTAGESIDDISKDFGLKKLEIRKALRFEGIKPDLKRRRGAWVH